MALQTMYLNSSVYEMVRLPDGEVQALYKQINNALLVKGVLMERRIAESYNGIAAEMKRHMAGGQFGEDDVRIMATYPIEYLDKDACFNFTVAYGWMIEFTRPDPSKPITVFDPTPEKLDEIRREALTWKPTVVPFALIVPETERYMFSLSLDYAPETAIVKQDAMPADELDAPFNPGMDVPKEYLRELAQTADRGGA